MILEMSQYIKKLRESGNLFDFKTAFEVTSTESAR